MMIRHADAGDIDAIVAMGEQFYATTQYTSYARFDRGSVTNLAWAMIGGLGFILVAEQDGVVVGMLGMVVSDFMFNASVKMAHEVMIWVQPEYRGTGAGQALMRAVAPACRERGVVAAQLGVLSTSPPHVAQFCERLGYRQSETLFTKVLMP